MSSENLSQPAPDAGLRRGVITGAELAAQAIANIAPSAVIAFAAASIFMDAGNGTVLSIILGTLVILCVGWCVVVFARKNASAGSLYTYVAKGLGAFGAYIAGSALLIGCFGITTDSLAGAVYYTSDLLVQLGIPADGWAYYILLTVILGCLATLFTIRGIRISARISLVLELVSIAIILVLFFVALFAAGENAISQSQFSLDGAAPQGIASGMVLAILGFVGFSSADALGREARSPYTAIPRAVMWSAAGIGVLYIFSAYTQIAVLGDELAEVPSPLQAIAKRTQMPDWFTVILTFGIAASFFAVVVAPLNVIGRIVYVMGKEGVAHSSFGRTHPQHLTPHRALLLFGSLAILINILLLAGGAAPMDIVVWAATWGTYGYMLAYTLVAFACIRYVHREKMRAGLVIFCATVAIVAMSYVFVANVWPVPEFPLNLLPYLFILCMLLALLRYVYLWRENNHVIAQIGQTETDVLKGIG